MPRAMWKGAVQFGLVTIPVKLYLATESKGISFNLLHADDNARIQVKTYCPAHDEVISRGETVRGFEYAPGEYVVVTDDDLERVPLKTVRSIEIELFTRARRDEGTIRFVKSAYYLEPDKIGQKAFALLRSVLAEQELTAICKVVIKDREALAALDPYEGTLLLSTLHWPDEIRATTDLDLPAADIEFKPAEKAMAEQLVGAMTAEFRAEDYHDEYREALLAVIEEKVAGREVSAPPAAAAPANLVDLMAALEASVNAARAGRTDEAPISVAAARAAKAARATGQTAPGQTATGQTATGQTPAARAGAARTTAGRASAGRAGTARAGSAATSIADAETSTGEPVSAESNGEAVAGRGRRRRTA